MCVFCRLVAGELPVAKVMETEDVLVFLDNAPVNPGHMLVIPKKHLATLEELNDELLGALILKVKEAGALLKTKLGYSGYNVILNNDPIAGQEIPHLHWHIIPRVLEDTPLRFPEKKYNPGEMAAICEKLNS
ncbi:MAG: HIT family protein [Patescibacteria group bacterium]|jgi:histidine triad (HIT) family protein